MSVIITIIQGATYPPPIGNTPATIAIDGDFSTWIPSGQIRKNYREELLADWKFHPIVYDAQSDRTIVSFWLGATDTATIPLPSQWRRDGEAPGTNVWVTDIELAEPSNPDIKINLLQGAMVRVKPEVTLNAIS